MTITRIDKTNEAFFAPLFLEAVGRKGPKILRIGAIEDGTACAAAAFELAERTAALLSIFVAPEYRRRGAAHALLQTFATLAAGTGITTLTVNFVPGLDDNAAAFLTAEGFELFSGSPVFAVSYEDAKNADNLKKYLPKADRSGAVLAFEDLSEPQRHELDVFMRGYGYALSEVTAGAFSPELSHVFYKNGNLVSGLFISETGRQLNVDFLFSRVSSAGPALAMVSQIAQRLAERETPPERIAFLAANPVVPAIADELFGHTAHAVNAASFGVRLLGT